MFSGLFFIFAALKVVGMSLQQRVMTEMKTAMKAKDTVALESLRAIKSAILLAQTDKGAGGELSEEDEVKLVQKLVKQRKDSATIFTEQGRVDLAEPELAQVAVIEQFLPEQLTAEEIEKVVMDSMGMTAISRQEVRALPNDERDAYMGKYMQVRGIVDAKANKRTDLPPAVDVGDLVDHIDYMVELIGIDHVGISSDFDGGGGIEGWSDASETFNVTLELVKRGYTEDEIAKLWGGNLLRVLDEVQALAATM